MPSGEIISRLQQAVAKQIDGLGVLIPNFEPVDQSPPSAAPSFFFSQAEIRARIELIRDVLPETAKEIVERADAILDNRIPILGYGFVDLGPEIDWHYDVINRKRAPLKPWPRIRYLDFDDVGDSKVTWEVNRHQFLPSLAKAWLLTGEDHYYWRLEALFYDWQQKNPYPLGINWCSSLEVAFRSLSWIWVYELLGSCQLATKLRHDITCTLGFNAWFIKRYLSTYFSPNTHLQGEAVALFFIGTLCPTFSQSAIWRDLGWKILMEHANSKVLPDGAYFEQSTYYHVYALDFFLHARLLAAKNSIQISPEFDETLKRMLNYLAALCQSGNPPRFGDDDGGRLFDGTRNRAAQLVDPLSIGAATYGLSSAKLTGRGPTEEMLWLLGARGAEKFEKLPTRQDVGGQLFPNAGVLISSLADYSRSQATMIVGQQMPGIGGHDHADALSITVNLAGVELLVDAGAFLYAGRNSERNDFRVTRAHNTATVDGRSQAEPNTAFSWLRRPVASIDTVIVSELFDFISASHDGYMRLSAPVIHRRSLFRIHNDFWMVFDELKSAGKHEYTIRWHVAANASIERNNIPSWIVGCGSTWLQILACGTDWVEKTESGWDSDSYGHRQISPVIEMTKQSSGVEELATLIWPGKHECKLPTLSQSHSCAEALSYEVRSEDARWLLLFSRGIGDIDLAGWETDARAICAKFDAKESLVQVIAIGGTYTRLDGQTFIVVPHDQEYAIWSNA